MLESCVGLVRAVTVLLQRLFEAYIFVFFLQFLDRVKFWVPATTVYLGFCLWAEDGPFARDSERGRELSRLSAIPSSFIVEKKMKVREREKFRCLKQP